MSWLRLDDGFDTHPKFDGWTTVEKWALLQLFLYCARQSTEGFVPNDFALLPKSSSKKLLAKAVDSGFIDNVDGELWIHDWKVYNPTDTTAAERMRRYRARRAVDESDGTRYGAVTAGERNADVTSRARPRARARPVPSPVTPNRPPDAARASDEAGGRAPSSTSNNDFDVPDFLGALDELRQGADDT